MCKNKQFGLKSWQYYPVSFGFCMPRKILAGLFVISIILFLFSVGVSIVSQLGILGFLAPIGWIITLVLVVVGIINAANGEMKPLPVIGQYQLLK